MARPRKDSGYEALKALEEVVTEDPERRRRELALIHIAKRDLGLDDETYRTMLYRIGGGYESAGEMGPIERGAVLRHLKEDLGWTPTSKPSRAPRRKAGRKPPHSLQSEERGPYLRKIQAILHDLDRPWEYADAIAQRMWKVARVEWCARDQLGGVIGAMEKERKRGLYPKKVRAARKLAEKAEEQA